MVMVTKYIIQMCRMISKMMPAIQKVTRYPGNI